jgi:RNA recognition motif-containing protein
MNIYVGNLAAEVTDDDLKDAFVAHGEVTSAKVIKDKYSGESRGFGFVEMPNKEEAQAAMQALNSKELKGRYLIINEARPRRDNQKRRRGGGGGFNRNRGRGGYSTW